MSLRTKFSESGHPVFRGSSALERGALRSKGKGKLSIHFCGDEDTAEVVLRTIISVNQLSVSRAVAYMCDELTWKISETCCSEQFGDYGDANRIVENEQSPLDQ